MSTQSGYPIVRAMVLHHEDDPTCWHIDNQFFCGENLLVCPVLNELGLRDVYLPEGEWVDLWTGERLHGAKWVIEVMSPPARIPVYARARSVVPVYPHAVQCTDEMDLTQVKELKFDHAYKGLATSVLGGLIQL